MSDTADLLTLPQAADLLGRDRSTLRSAVDRGTLPILGQIGKSDGRKGIFVIRRKDLEDYALRNGIEMQT